MSWFTRDCRSSVIFEPVVEEVGDGVVDLVRVQLRGFPECRTPIVAQDVGMRQTIGLVRIPASCNVQLLFMMLRARGTIISFYPEYPSLFVVQLIAVGVREQVQAVTDRWISKEPIHLAQIQVVRILEVGQQLRKVASGNP